MTPTIYHNNKDIIVFLFVFIIYSHLLYLDLTQVICKEISDNSDDKLASKQISQVCRVEDDGTWKYLCFTTSELNSEMLHNLILFGKYSGDFNKIFEYCWDQQIKLSDITTIKDVSYDSVYEKVWKPTVKQCQLLLSVLRDKSITLEEVEFLYRMQNFSLQLLVLCNAMHQCYPKPSESLILATSWVSNTVSHIERYHEIANNPKCKEAAKVILDVKASLELKGDFKIIEDLAKHVCAYIVNCTHSHACSYMSYTKDTNKQTCISICTVHYYI